MNFNQSNINLNWNWGIPDHNFIDHIRAAVIKNGRESMFKQRIMNAAAYVHAHNNHSYEMGALLWINKMSQKFTLFVTNVRAKRHMALLKTN